jgi:ATP-dependent Clp protease ATP-binding subunit ClpA
MITRLARDARSLVALAEREARSNRSPLVEAEHLLLAMATQPDTAAGQLLSSVGLTQVEVVQALRREFETSLAGAGVEVAIADLAQSTPDPSHRVRLGASFKTALSRSVGASAGAPRIRTEHLLLGILAAREGTVPRALRLAGVDQAALAARTAQSLAT